MRRLVAGVLLAIGTAMPALAQQAVLDRLTLREETFGWEAVGRLEIGRDGFCTGTLIAPDVVLTAAHCLFAPNGRHAPVDLSALEFRAGLRDGQAVAERAVTMAAVDPAYRAGSVAEADMIRSDVALLKLRTPIPAAIAAPFAVASLGSRTREVSVVSFAAGRAEAPSLQRDCAVLGREPGLMAFSCNVWFGSSGAPVFEKRDGRMHVVSMISAGNRETWKTVAFGMELPARVRALQTALATGRGLFGSNEAPRNNAAARVAQDAGSRLPKGGAARTDAGGARFVRPPAP